MPGPRRNYVQKTTGKKVKGVTTIEGVLNKPGLLYWAYKQGLANYEKLSQEVAKTIGKKKLTANQKLDLVMNVIASFEVGQLYDKRDEAGAGGTLAHEFLENHFRGLPLPSTKGKPKAVVTKAEGCFATCLNWEKTINLEIREIEVSLTSEQRPFGGSIDYTVKSALTQDLPNSIEILDLKTGKGIYLSAKIQVGAYGELYVEHHPEVIIGGFHILRVGPDGEFNHNFYPTLKPYWEIFKACLFIQGRLDDLGERL